MIIINKDEVKHKFVTMHSKFAQSPLMVQISSGVITVICLPIDLKSIIRQLQEERVDIKIRVMGEKYSVLCVSKTDGYAILDAMAKRFDASKLNLLDSLKKLETLTTVNQINKLSGEFHGYYRTLIKTDTGDNIKDAASTVGRC